MAKYVISERAKNDLREIADYTQRRWSDEQAERYVRMLFDTSISFPFPSSISLVV